MLGIARVTIATLLLVSGVDPAESKCDRRLEKALGAEPDWRLSALDKTRVSRGTERVSSAGANRWVRVSVDAR